MTSDDRVSRARRGLGLYFAVVVPLSAVIEWKIATSGGTISDHPGLVLGLMWTPALAMLVARVALREGARDVSFRLRAPKGHEGPKAPLARPLLVAWLSPVLVGALAYGAAWGLRDRALLPQGHGDLRPLAHPGGPSLRRVPRLEPHPRHGALGDHGGRGRARLARVHAHAPRRRQGAVPRPREHVRVGALACAAHRCGRVRRGAASLALGRVFLRVDRRWRSFGRPTAVSRRAACGPPCSFTRRGTRSFKAPSTASRPEATQLTRATCSRASRVCSSLS
jgi:hypothetical protein